MKKISEPCVKLTDANMLYYMRFPMKTRTEEWMKKNENGPLAILSSVAFPIMSYLYIFCPKLYIIISTCRILILLNCF